MKLIISFSFFYLLFHVVHAYTFLDYIKPNFTASHFQFIDNNSGTFLLSQNRTFEAAIFNPGGQQTSLYLCVIHAASSSVVWSANRDNPISEFGIMNLTINGIVIVDEDGDVKWSTPPLRSLVDRLVLNEMGNLVLLDQSNVSLWESFQHPTDTIVIGQRLPIGTWLSSAASDSDLSAGNYNLTITASDAILQWYGQDYWKLSTDTKAYKNSNDMVEYMEINRTGFYLFGHDGVVPVFVVSFPLSDFRIAKLAISGQFVISSFSGTDWNREFVGPGDGCQIPLACGRVGLCNDKSSTPVCSCPPDFYVGSGSIISSDEGEDNMLGFIKVIVASTTTDDDDQTSQKNGFPVAASVLLPITGIIIIVSLVFLSCRRMKVSKAQDVQLGKSISHSSSNDMDAFYIPGLPRRFDYEELEDATDNFKTLIGSGGFGSVYRGVLSDNTVVAVKKIINIGIQGKKDFCTEIGVIGNTYHANLVKLKGFCAQGRHRLLVYEYMNRGSLDRTLFGTGPVLEWQERSEVALGTARGLAYLHSGCEQKIIHCDIKPENILLQDQFQAKISDFGLSKFLSPEQSGLFTTMRGTRGYLAPEWLTNSAISEKTDVYSFGMVLLELVSGRKNCYFRSNSHSVDDGNSGGGHSSNSSTTGLVYFPLFALEMHEQGNYLELADQRLEGRVTNDEVEKLVRIALCCVHEEPAIRPNMVAVVGILEGEIPSPQPRIESLNFLRFYGRRFTEASMIAEESEYNCILNQQGRNSTSQNSFSYISSETVSGPR
ncbi:PREDICTED: G-type lectin S-receptor-like serine/threonine-protein kinase At5g35370 isoform X2 [Lupinus angustifolius]|uniref:G-type lectin S-receptor-like serine/threonine-protein kinase At5g35370 isoform X2 n=1 Tax=Lupinus angustifolius TaxID=3871 RepID=UPI00092F2244|nr:PREDICTED: G-type lectin S-receptor-like serine/threonine-protein kinase At5g35370 isoform X2 [Lupinus angustifolius]